MVIVTREFDAPRDLVFAPATGRPGSSLPGARIAGLGTRYPTAGVTWRRRPSP